MSSFVPHFAFGATIGVIAAGASIPLVDTPTVTTIVTPLITGIMGALTPDMDIKSKSSQIMYLIFLSISIYFFLTDRVDLAFLTLLYSIIPQFFGHRGFIHSFIFGVISAVGLYFVLTELMLFQNESALIASVSYLTGFLLHKLLDEV